ncbi:hypothetical protein EVAR_58088_1 [Eumeta japonica]|uniref:Uncharacterized protein n=1 Tax=Eumeta variegata TaxID=151549 RepID=A0A4C1YNU1_EUMVA|nr:hypothetical protein EVAR_58088_1 [Eumeta japonica]
MHLEDAVRSDNRSRRVRRRAAGVSAGRDSGGGRRTDICGGNDRSFVPAMFCLSARISHNRAFFLIEKGFTLIPEVGFGRGLPTAVAVTSAVTTFISDELNVLSEVRIKRSLGTPGACRTASSSETRYYRQQTDDNRNALNPENVAAFLTTPAAGIDFDAKKYQTVICQQLFGYSGITPRPIDGTKWDMDTNVLRRGGDAPARRPLITIK